MERNSKNNLTTGKGSLGQRVQPRHKMHAFWLLLTKDQVEVLIFLIFNIFFLVFHIVWVAYLCCFQDLECLSSSASY